MLCARSGGQQLSQQRNALPTGAPARAPPHKCATSGASEHDYTADGQDKLTFLDASGGEIGRISQQLLSLCPSSKVSRAGQVLAVVRKDLFNLFRCSFSVDVPAPDDLEAAGNLLEHAY